MKLSLHLQQRTNDDNTITDNTRTANELKM